MCILPLAILIPIGYLDITHYPHITKLLPTGEIGTERQTNIDFVNCGYAGVLVE